MGGGSREGRFWGGVQVGILGWWGGGWHKALVVTGGGAHAPLTSPCPPSDHTITISLTVTLAATWNGHASHIDSAEHHTPNFIHGRFCHIIALHFGPQYSL